jgi:hypothetical protein
VFDIKAFHRTCPVLPAHKPFLVVGFDGGYYLDHCYPFSASSASSNAGQICNAIVDIWKAEMKDDRDSLKFEDDLNTLRYPYTEDPVEIGSFLYCLDRVSITVHIDPIGTPWHPVKTGLAFLYHTVFLGLYWDLVLHRVSLPEDKRAKYLARVQEMLAACHINHKFSLVNLQEMHSALCHLCFLFADGASRLAVFSNTMAGFKGSSFACLGVSKPLRHTLQWWEAKIADPTAYCQL